VKNSLNRLLLHTAYFFTNYFINHRQYPVPEQGWRQSSERRSVFHGIRLI